MGDRDRADVGVVIGGDVPALRVGVRLVMEGRREVGRRVGIDPLGDRRREDVHLERRARLPPRLSSQVVLVMSVPGRNRGLRLIEA